MSNRILLVGASGQVGTACRALAPGGIELLALSHAELDIGDATRVAASVDAFKPSLIINTAAYTAVDKAETDIGGAQRGNVEGPRHLAAAARAAGARLIHLSTDFVFDGRATRSFCAVRPPGHHALRDRAMGFCLFGNVAIGARHARVKHGAERVLIVDWDVHHGNGTQAIVEHEPDIRFVSMHQWPWYPGTGSAEDRGPHRSIWNVPMAGGLPPERYVTALLRAVDAATTHRLTLVPAD